MPEPLPRGRNPFDENGVVREQRRPRTLQRAPALAAGDAARERGARSLGDRAARGRRFRAELRRAVGALGARRRRPRGARRRARRPGGDPHGQRRSTGCSRSSARSCSGRWRCRSTPASPRRRPPTSSATRERRYTFEDGVALPLGEPLIAEDIGPGDLAAIFYTSGTTGFPKGAMTTPRELPHQQRERAALQPDRPLRRPRDLDARLRPAVPRHGLQQPADPAAGAGRPRRDPLRTAGLRRVLRGGRRARRQPARLGARDLPRRAAPSALRRAGRQPRALDLLRRRADLREPRPPDHAGVPERARGQRLRAHGDLLADLLPAPRGGSRARRLGRLRDAGRRSRDRRGRPERRRRAAGARPERRAGVLEQARGDGGDLRRRLAAHRRPRAGRLRTGCSTSSTARRT